MSATLQHVAPSGLLIIDKPQGVTSFDAVAAVRAALHIKKVGHAGTLDPMATGALVIAFGHATRLLASIVEHDKTYEATIRLGRRTTTDDAEGDFIDANGDTVDADTPLSRAVTERLARIDKNRLREVTATHFIGDIMQVPSTFSAIKVNGRRAYDLARDGKDVELKSRKVTISEFAVLGVETAAAGESGGHEGRSAMDHEQVSASSGVNQCLDVRVRVSCSSGTYIRALARDLGNELGVGGYLTRLRRTRVGRFALPDDTSGVLDDAAMKETRKHTVTAHTETKTFTNREGETITRNKCVLDMPGVAPTGTPLAAAAKAVSQAGCEPSVDERCGQFAADVAQDMRKAQGEKRRAWLLEHALTMEQAARGAMPCADITAEEAVELRFGRRITCAVNGSCAAIVPETHDVVALIEPASHGQAKPVTVFPAV